MVQPMATPPRNRPNRAPGQPSARGRVQQSSVAVHIRCDLRDAITSLRLKPGVAVSEKGLAQTYGVSRTPVREAIARLVEEGLVSVYPQAGTFVSLIPFHHLPEALVVRRSLEIASARFAAERATAGRVASIRAVGDNCRAALASGDQDAFHKADDAFHAAVAEAAALPGLWRVVVRVKVQLDRFRRLIPLQARQATRILEEHAVILRAIGAGDPDAAAVAMEAHVAGVLADLDPIARARPDYFDMNASPEQAHQPPLADGKPS